jgi:hypothetical protein
MKRSLVDLWANFLYNEKLDPARMEEEWVLEIMKLCEALAANRAPIIKPYKEKLKSRAFVCEIAMELGIDLPSIRNKRTRKYLIGRGLLDAWNKVTATKYGSSYGTQSEWEAKRRDVKTRLAKKRKEDERKES